MAVSYTHLDVYKRQSLKRPVPFLRELFLSRRRPADTGRGPRLGAGKPLLGRRRSEGRALSLLLR